MSAGRIGFFYQRRQCSPIFWADEDIKFQTSILVAEHHPTRPQDEIIERFAAAVSGKVRLTYFTALDEPLMQRFSGEWVSETLQRLGMQADECIESAMVAKRVTAAQRKVRAAALSDEPLTPQPNGSTAICLDAEVPLRAVFATLPALFIVRSHGGRVLWRSKN